MEGAAYALKRRLGCQSLGKAIGWRAEADSTLLWGSLWSATEFSYTAYQRGVVRQLLALCLVEYLRESTRRERIRWLLSLTRGTPKAPKCHSTMFRLVWTWILRWSGLGGPQNKEAFGACRPW